MENLLHKLVLIYNLGKISESILHGDYRNFEKKHRLLKCTGHNNLNCTQDYRGDIRSNSLEIGCVQNDLNYSVWSTDLNKHRLRKTFPK